MAINEILTFADLQELSNRRTAAAVADWLTSQGIAYHRDADRRPWTTLAALDRALQRSVTSQPDLSVFGT